MKSYNGHRSYNAWNIALWIGNDEGLYRFALDCLKRAKNDLDRATRYFMQHMGGMTTMRCASSWRWQDC
jgi:hypothetical protein